MYKGLLGLTAFFAVNCLTSTSSFGANWEYINSRNSTQVASATSNPSPHLSQLLGLGNQEELIEVLAKRDIRGNSHRRIQQTFMGLPIHGQQITVHDNSVSGMRISGKLARSLDNDLYFSISPLFNFNGLMGVNDHIYLQTALAWLEDTTGKPYELWNIDNVSNQRQIFVTENGQSQIVRFVEFLAVTEDESPVRGNVLIRELDGTIIRAWNSINHVDATGPGGNEKTGQYFYGDEYRFLNVSESEGTCLMQNDAVTTVDLQNQFDLSITAPFSFECYENTYQSINGAYSPINDAHFFGQATVDMYQQWLGEPPLPLPLQIKVHFGTEYANAFWDGNASIFGDGNNELYPLVDANIVSHEIAHGFTERHSNLFYYGQSGGINESFSDIAGEAAEFYLKGSVDWLTGNDVSKTDTPFRYFADPTLDGVSIGHADDYQPGIDVHHSSGVYNKAFYLLANSNGWGIQQGFLLFSHANQYYWTQTTDFVEGLCGLLNAAEDLSYDKKTIFSAFSQVGLYCPTDETDTDEDGMPDGWEAMWGLNPNDPNDANQDPDSDGLLNIEEYQSQSNPFLIDTDDDTLSDYDEVKIFGTSPILSDSDTDQLPDAYELENGLNPNDAADASADADGDGNTNLEEYQLGTDPNDPNSMAIRYATYRESFEEGIPNYWIESDSSNNVWDTRTIWSSDGDYSLTAINFNPGDTAAVNLTRLYEAGTLTLDYRVNSSYNLDFLTIELDGAIRLQRSGYSSGKLTINIPEGIHTLTIRYQQSSDNSNSNDWAMVDNITYMIEGSDLDGDGIPNPWEVTYGLDYRDPADALLDNDDDGLDNLGEYNNNSDPNNPDSDGDTLTDGEEVNVHGTLPDNPDSDSDLLPDNYEITHQLNPLDAADADQDLDNDGNTNLEEYQLGTNPNDIESSTTRYAYFLESFETGVGAEWQLDGSPTPYWQQTDSWATDGSYSLTASNTPDNTAVTAKIVRLFEPGTVRFNYRVSTEISADWFEVYVDNIRVVRISGSSGNYQKSLQINSGVHAISFIYSKNESGNSILDSVWVDALEFISERDIDEDGMPSLWEVDNGLNPQDASDAELDPDIDGLTNIEEFQNETNPAKADTDGDLLKDGDEVNLYGTSPILKDTDGDTIPDRYEVINSLDPLDPSDAEIDADGDGTTNLEEYERKTDPNDATDFLLPLRYFFDSFEGTLSKLWKLDGNDTYTRDWKIGTNWSSHGKQSLLIDYMRDWDYSTAEITQFYAKGTLYLDYSIRTEPDADYFSVQMDNSTKLYTSGEQSGTLEIPLEQGFHTLQLGYRTDRNYWGFVNYVRVDAVRFVEENTDGDADGMPTLWELANGFDPDDPADAAQDRDGDGLTNLGEFSAGTNPDITDSDGDTLSDGDEVNLYNSNPLNTDSDSDLIPDDYEVANQLDPSDPNDAALDNDKDGSSNLDEYQKGSDPNDPLSVYPTQTYFFESFENGLPSDFEPTGENENNSWRIDSNWSSEGNNSLVGELSPLGRLSINFTRNFEAGKLFLDYNIVSSGPTNYYFPELQVMASGRRIATVSYKDGVGSLAGEVPEGTHNISFSIGSSFLGSLAASTVSIDSLMFITHGDLDGDQMGSVWEYEHGFDIHDPSDGSEDADGDGLDNAGEFLNGSDPFIADTDGDTISDADEVLIYGTSPIRKDTDLDQMSDLYEINHGLDPNSRDDAAKDLDGDGTTNKEEHDIGTDPQDANSKAYRYAFIKESFERELPQDFSVTASESGVQWQQNSEWSSHQEHSFSASGLTTTGSTRLEFTRLISAGSLTISYRTETASEDEYLSLIVVRGGVTSTFTRSGSDSGTFTMANIPSGVITVALTYNRRYSSGPAPGQVWIDEIRFISDNDDVDNDGLPNEWEYDHGLNPHDSSDKATDPDLDGLTNEEEFAAQSHPQLKDSDGDGIEDMDEVRVYQTLPYNSDSDDDGIDDLYELTVSGLDPNDPLDAEADIDTDGMSNLEEYDFGTNPLDAESNTFRHQYFVESFETTLNNEWVQNNSNGDILWRTSDFWSSDGQRALCVELAPGAASQIRIMRLYEQGSLTVQYHIQSNERSERLNFSILNNDNPIFTDLSSSSTYHRSLTLASGVNNIEFRADAKSSSVGGTVCIDEIFYLSDNPDIDNDGLPNDWELKYGFDLMDPSDAGADTDTDGVTNLDEYTNNGNPFISDTDYDGLDDYTELYTTGTSINRPDTDNDGIWDGYEVAHGFDPLVRPAYAEDTDGDGFLDLDEFKVNTNPLDASDVPELIMNFSEGFEEGIPESWRFASNSFTNRWFRDNSWSYEGDWSLRAQPEIMEGFSLEFSLYSKRGVLSFQTNGAIPSSFSISVNGITRYLTYDSSTNTRSLNLLEGFNTIRLIVSPSSSYRSDFAIDNLKFIGESEMEDYDLDGIDTGWERDYGLDPYDPSDAQLDFDRDGFSNLQEYQAGTNPLRSNVDLQVSLSKLFETNSTLLRYRITVTNNSARNAQDIEIDNQLPIELVDSMSYQLGTDSALLCELLAATLSCNAGSLPPGGIETITVSLTTPDGSTKYPVGSSVRSAQQDSEFDENNNQAEATYTGGSLGIFLLLALSLLGLIRAQNRQPRG